MMFSLRSYQRLQCALFCSKTLPFQRFSSQQCRTSRQTRATLRKDIRRIVHDTEVDSVNFIFDEKKRVIVYTDGCCYFNNSLDVKKRKAGIGVYWGENDHPLNLSMGIYEKNLSSNRAELLAAHAAVQLAIELSFSELCLRVDSLYVKTGCEQWLQKWQSNRWRAFNGDPVKNQDLWKPLAKDMLKVQITFEKVNDESSEGQKMAHNLANAAARLMK